MPNPVNLVIRDAVLDDVAQCLDIDHRYETDHVWQMTVQQDDGWQIVFRSERLPRTLEETYQPDEQRLRDSIKPEHCFLVATERASRNVLGYLVMRRDTILHLGQIVDFAIDRDVRRSGIGKRLISIASSWAKEHQITRIQVAVQTTNLPAINFLQSIGFTFCGFNDHYFRNRDIAVFFSQAVR